MVVTMLLLSVFGQNQRAEKRFGIKVLLRKNHSQTLVVSNLLRESTSFSNGRSIPWFQEIT